VEGADADTQEPRRVLAVLVTLGESREDCVAFRLLDHLLEGSGAVAAGLDPQGAGKVLDVDDRTFDRHDELLDDVAKLADVAGSRMVAEDPHGRGGDLLGIAVVPQPRLLEEVRDQLGMSSRRWRSGGTRSRTTLSR
jgi:hypothetical protein